MLPTSIDAYFAWLGLAWVGATEVPLNVDYRGQMLVHGLTQCDTQVLVTTSSLLRRVAEIGSALPHLQTVILSDEGMGPADLPFRVLSRSTFLDGARPAEELEGPKPSDPACIIYTSGTTGPSKGVIDPWLNIYLSSLRVFPAELMDQDEVIYGAGQVYHLSGKFPPYLATVLGGRVVLRERMSMSEYWSDINAFGCTNTVLPGTVAYYLLRMPETPDDARTPLRNVSMAPVIPEYREFASRFGVRIATMYGMTETGMVMRRLPEEINPETYESVGKPHPGFEVRLVDKDDSEVETGTTGELTVRSVVPWALNGGYYGMPEMTAEAWRNGWFHTGDGFRQDEHGNFYFVDRLKDCIRRRGENISSFEIEANVAQHPAVLDCSAIPVPDARGHLYDEEVKVVVVLRPDETLAPQDLIAFLIPRMPRFMIPRYVEFVEELPKTQNLKTQKYLLRHNALNSNTWDRVAAGVELPR